MLTLAFIILVILKHKELHLEIAIFNKAFVTAGKQVN